MRAFCSSYRENLRHLLLEAMFPMRNLRRMHSVRAGEFIDCVEPFEGFQRHTGFELCAVLFPLCRHPSLLTSCAIIHGHSILSSSPVQFSGYIIYFGVAVALRNSATLSF